YVDHASLFFRRSHDLRDLHSFPTRRSSDLTVWMSPPRLETSVAAHRARKLPLRSGAIIDDLELKPNPSSVRRKPHNRIFSQIQLIRIRAGKGRGFRIERALR